MSDKDSAMWSLCLLIRLFLSGTCISQTIPNDKHCTWSRHLKFGEAFHGLLYGNTYETQFVIVVVLVHSVH